MRGLRYFLLIILVLFFSFYYVSCGSSGSDTETSEDPPQETPNPEPAQGSLTITPDLGIVQFFQNFYTFPGLKQNPSLTRIKLNQAHTEGILSGVGFVEIDTGKIQQEGYLQVYLESGRWAVQNMFVEPNIGKLGTEFFLVDELHYSKEVQSISAYVVITDIPLLSPEFKQDQVSIWQVSPREYNAEGIGEPVTSIPYDWEEDIEYEIIEEAVPEPLKPFLILLPQSSSSISLLDRDAEARRKVAEEIDKILRKEVFDKATDRKKKLSPEISIPIVSKTVSISKDGNTAYMECRQQGIGSRNVEAQESQCGPAAAANSFAWLSKAWGIKLNHENKPGFRDKTLVGQFDIHMDRQRNKGVSHHAFIRGKMRYAAANNICLSFKHRSSVVRNVSEGRFTSEHKGLPDFYFLCREVCKGQDVEILYEHATGGHAVIVTACSYHRVGDKLAFRITFEHDTNQGKPGGTDVEMVYIDGSTVGFWWKGRFHTGLRIAPENPLYGAKWIRGHIKSIVSESPPEAEGKTAKDVCPWMVSDNRSQPDNPSGGNQPGNGTQPDNPSNGGGNNPPQEGNQPGTGTQSLRERCTGVRHFRGESFVWVCVEGSFNPEDRLTVNFPTIGTSWSNLFTSPSSCVCTTEQPVTEYGTYPYNAIYVPVGGQEQSLSGSIQVGSEDRPCSCN